MKTPLDYMDYVYYRCAKFYDKYDRLEKGELVKRGFSYTALLIVTGPIVYFVIIMGIVINAKILGNKGYVVSNIHLLSITALFLVVMIINYFRYRHLYEELERRWGNQSTVARYFGSFLVIIYTIIPFILLALFMKYLPVM